MVESIKRVQEFHTSFGLSVGTKIAIPTKEEQALHYKLMLEELDEFKEACANNDMVGIADGLADVMFVLLSSVVSHGLQNAFMDAFNEVCDSNMSKLDANGKPIYREDGKVMKSDIYFRPNIQDIIAKHARAEEELACIKDQIGNK